MSDRVTSSSALCPLCVEPLDATDMSIRYCSCGYQLCRLCWHQLMENASKDEATGKCPNCRISYDKEKIAFLNNTTKKEEPEEKKKKKTEKKKGVNLTAKSRKHLQDLRILQRNLVYAVGLSMEICKEEVLQGDTYFGQFGKIKKISVNRSSPYSSGQSRNGPTGASYVTFFRIEDAADCVEAIDGAIWDGRYIRACFGTTKYCQAFLKGAQCNNSDCLYMHHIVNEGTFTKEDMNSGFANGKPDFYNLINFDRQKGPVPGSLANKPPKGPEVSRKSRDEGKQDSGNRELQDWPELLEQGKHSQDNYNKSIEHNQEDFEIGDRPLLLSRRSAQIAWPPTMSPERSKLMSTSSVPPPTTRTLNTMTGSPITPGKNLAMMGSQMHVKRSPRLMKCTASGSDLLKSKPSVDSNISIPSQISEEGSFSGGRILDQTDGLGNNPGPVFTSQQAFAESILGAANASGSLNWSLISKGSCDSFLSRSTLQNILEDKQNPYNELLMPRGSGNMSLQANIRRGPPPGFDKLGDRNGCGQQQEISDLLIKASLDAAAGDQRLCNNALTNQSVYDYQRSLFANDSLDQSIYNRNQDLLMGPFDSASLSPFPSALSYGPYGQSNPSLDSRSSGVQPLPGAASLPNELLQTLITASNFPQQGGGVISLQNTAQLGSNQETPQSILQNRMSVDVLDPSIYGYGKQRVSPRQKNLLQNRNNDVIALKNLLQQMHHQPSGNQLLHSRRSVDSFVGKSIGNNLSIKKEDVLSDPSILSYKKVEAEANNNISSINSITGNITSGMARDTLSGNCNEEQICSAQLQHQLQQMQQQDFLSSSNLPITPFAVPSSPPQMGSAGSGSIGGGYGYGSGYIGCGGSSMPATPFDSPFGNLGAAETQPHFDFYGANTGLNSTLKSHSSLIAPNQFSANQPLCHAFGSGSLWTPNPQVDADSGLFEGISHAKGLQTQIPQ